MASTRHIGPFVLRNMTLLPLESAPNEWQVYDSNRQLWIDVRSGEPLVASYLTEDAKDPMQSDFGETLLTQTREGVDKSEVSASEFGETSMTKTREGADQAESPSDSLSESAVGETMPARTREESAKTERLVLSPFGETSVTNSAGEGTDRAAEEPHILEW